jgi:hypothetical protein
MCEAVVAAPMSRRAMLIMLTDLLAKNPSPTDDHLIEGSRATWAAGAAAAACVRCRAHPPYASRYAGVRTNSADTAV